MKKTSLIIALCLVVLFSFTLSTTCFADVSPTPQGPTIGSDQFLFIDSHRNRNGIGDVGPGMMIDFPTYSYSQTSKILNSFIQIGNYSPETKVIVGSGMSITGTAGGGISSVLKAYDSFSSEGLFFVDPDFTVHFFMQGAWRVVAPGETWTTQVEEQPAKYTGKYVNTYSVTNYGVLKKSDIVQPTPAVTATPTTPYTHTPVITSTPTPEIRKYKICGYVKSVPPLLMESDGAKFKFEIAELGLSAISNSIGYFEINGVPESKTGTSYTLKISKPGYLTRTIKNLWVGGNLEIGSTNNRISMLSGDVNDDGAINMADIFVLAKAFNTIYSDTNFNKTADLNYDNAINMSDIMVIAGNFNNSSSSYTTPYMASLYYYNLNVNDYMTVNETEGSIAGITWNYSIDDINVVQFVSLTTVFEQKVPDGVTGKMWTFKAISKGSAVITFKSTPYGNIQKHIVTVTDGTSVSPIPTAFPDSEPEVVDSKDLKSTLISTDSEQKIVSGKNIVYCPTFQMAWDEFKNIIGGDIKLSGNPTIASTLNNGFPMTGSLTPESYVSMAGYGNETITKINSALKNKFGDSAPVVNESIGPCDIIAYSYLFKNLGFSKSFEVMNTPLNFTSGGISTGVKNFGISPLSKKSSDLAKQVKIYDYKSSNDFIVKLLPEDSQNEIILAKTAPQDSLYKTYTSIVNRINNSGPIGYDSRDTLRIPVLDFNISHSYSELEGRSILNPGFEGYFIQKACQRTRFNLDENGAILASEATIIGTVSIYTPKELIFDGPFMIILKEKNATNPYLMIWVDNPELLVKYAE